MSRTKRFKDLINSTRSGIAGAFTKFKARRPHLSTGFYLCIFGLFLGAAAYFRFWAAPLSAGVDVPQFWAFAKVFQLHGLDFYRYADADLSIFPVKGWGFVYPPVWLLLLRLALVFSPMSAATNAMVDSSWRLAMKTPIIAADLAIGCLLYWAVPGAKWKKLLFAGLWLFHPTSWYNSAVFGQFDAIAAALLLASVILLERGNDKIAFLIAGLAIMTKQHVFIPVALMIAASVKSLGWRRLMTDVAILAGVAIVLSIPFLITGNFFEYASSLLFPGQSPGYQIPVMYAFNGWGSLLTFLHLDLGWETKGFFIYGIPLSILAVIAGLVFSYRRNITPAQAALVGFLIFISFFYRVNYQYLVIYIPLALLVASQTKFRSERIIAIVIALLPAVWLWLFNVSFWFYNLEPKYIHVVPMLERIGLTHNDVPDLAYVILAMVLMCLFLTYIILTFTRWRKRTDVLGLHTGSSIGKKQIGKGKRQGR